jgi:hypothetical protein
MKAYGGMDVWIHFSWPRHLLEVICQLHTPTVLPPEEISPGNQWIGSWVDPRAGRTLWRRENSWPYRYSNSDPSVVQSVASRYTDWAIPASTFFNVFFDLVLLRWMIRCLLQAEHGMGDVNFVTCLYIVIYLGVTIDGVWIGELDLLITCTQLGITSNYSAIANIHILQITTC